MNIYLAICTCGYGDEHYCDHVYVGTDFQAACDAVKNFCFESESNQSGWVETWFDGKFIKSTTIIE